MFTLDDQVKFITWTSQILLCGLKETVVEFNHQCEKNIFVTVSRSEVSGILSLHPLHEKCPFLEFFWPVFSRIWTRKNPNTGIRVHTMQWNRSSHRRWSVKKDVLKDFVNFTGKYLCWGLFLIKTCNF